MGQINTTVKYPSVTYPTTVTQLGTAIDLNTSEVAGQLGIANGGTGSPTASGARSSLGVVIGTDVQAYSPALTVFASNSSSYYLSRNNHTGTQNVSTVTGLTDYATLTSTVPVVSGGTGSPTASGARSNLGVVIGTDVQAHSQDLDEIGQLFATGHVSGGQIVSPTSTTFNVSAGRGHIVDNYTNPLTPVVTHVDWTAQTGLSDTYLTTTLETQIVVDLSGNIIQLSALPTADQRRDYIYLGKTVHTDLSSIGAIANVPKVVYDSEMNTMDLIEALGPINMSGNLITANGANLSINKSAGKIFRLGANYANSTKTPSIVTTSGLTPVQFKYRFRNGTGGFTTNALTSTVDPGNYDDGSGTLAAVGTGNWSIQRVYYFTIGTCYITYGQAVYTTLAAAVDAITSELPVVDPQFVDANLLCYLVMKGNLSSLQDTANSKISKADRINPL